LVGRSILMLGKTYERNAGFRKKVGKEHEVEEIVS
jgi:hypothetical protein